MKKILVILGALALVAAVSTSALAKDEICQERKAEITDISPKKDIIYTFKDCDAKKQESAQSTAKKGI